MFHSIVEKNQVHSSINFIILSKSISKTLGDVVHICELVVKLFVETADEVSENQGFGSWDSKVLVQVELTEGFLAAVSSKSAILNEVLVVDKTITVDSF